MKLGFDVPVSKADLKVPYPIWRPSLLAPRAATVEEGMIFEAWRRCTQRGRELRNVLDGTGKPDRWPLVPVESEFWNWKEALSFR